MQAYCVHKKLFFAFPGGILVLSVRALSSLRGLRGAPEVPIMPRDAVSRTANLGTVGKNGLRRISRAVRTQPTSESPELIFARCEFPAFVWLLTQVSA